MTPQGFTLFETTIGRCGVVFGQHGIAGIQLPERTLRETRAKIRERFPGARETTPSGAAEHAVGRIVALLAGERHDLSDVALDMRDVPTFHRKVYEQTRRIGPGETSSYGEVAQRVGSPGAARAVGQALGRNPFAIVVPCHRVLAANGKIGGFTANGGVGTKRKMLAIESAIPKTDPELEHGFPYDPALAVGHLRRNDEALAQLIETVGPFTLKRNRTQSVFLALAEAIVYQQLTGKAAGTIFGRVQALFAKTKGGFTPLEIMRCPEEKLRAAGLSQAKMLALKDLAKKTASGELPTLEEIEAMDDAAIVARLTTVRGVGRWTVEMFLLFRLGRQDVFPLDDYGVKKGFAVIMGHDALPEKKALEAHAARYAPYRSVASWYLWRAADLASRKSKS